LPVVRLRTLGLVVSSLVGLVPVATVAAVVIPTGIAAAASPGAASAYVALPTPTRLLDSRDSFGALGPGGVATINVTGAAPLPAPGTTVAAVLNITVLGPAVAGFWTAFPHGAPRPLAASLYVDERAALLGSGLALPNLVTVPVAADGTVDIYSQNGGALVVDMLGSYTSVSGSTSAGRFVALAAPTRIYDGRDLPAMTPDSTATVNVPGGAGAAAAVVSVTTIATGRGFWTLSPTGQPRPLAANLYSIGPFHLGANQAIVPLSPDGAFDVYSQGGGFPVVDLIGTITGASAPADTAGLFVPLAAPTRFLDTRDATLTPLGGAKALQPTWTAEVPVATNPAIGRSDVAALAVNVTVTDPLAGGYVTLSPAGADAPNAPSRSTATVTMARAGQIVADHATVAVSPRGFSAFALVGANVVVDVSGYYLGTPAPATFPAQKNVDRTPAGCLAAPAQAIGAVVSGISRAGVARVQQRLIDLGFWLGAADGSYGLTTSQAVMAYQKWIGLPRTTSVDEQTAVALNTPQCRPTPGVTSGDLIEVDKGKQLMFIIRGGKAQWIVNVSTGGNYFYTATDKNTGAPISDQAVTPNGDFRVYRVSDDPAYKGSLGTLYRPRFIVGGVAVHGYSSVPNFPASHGCVRVTNAAMDMIWGTNAMPLRSRVVIHD
jgi:lipoprotein-anchoring transpeptidase ErfK/SrfK